MKKSMILSGLFILLLLAPEYSQAQRKRGGVRRPIAAGPQVGIALKGAYEFDHEVWAAGGQVQIPLGRTLTLVPGGCFYFYEQETLWQMDIDARFGRPRGALYFGGGLSIVPAELYQGNETASGANAFVGMQTPRLRRSSVQPFVQAKWTFVKEQQWFRLEFGLTF